MSDHREIEVDAPASEVRLDRRCVRVSPRAATFLLLFAGRTGDLVTKDEAITALWDGRAVSDSALSTVVKDLRRALGDDGAHQKIIRTVHGMGFRCLCPVRAAGPAAAPAPRQTPEPPIDNRPLSSFGQPALAILPFEVRGPERETADYLGEAIPAELIATLSRLRWIALTARASAFRLSGRRPDFGEVGRSLGVGYCLTGLVEAARGRLAVATELARLPDGRVIWSDRISGRLDDVHDLRGKVAAAVTGALEIRIPLAEAERARLLPPENLDAWAEFHIGLRHLYRFNPKDNLIARSRFERAIARAPGFARAHAGLSFSSFQAAFMAYGADRAAEIARATAEAERSLALDPLDPFGAYCMGRSCWAAGDPEAAGAWMGRSVEICPNFAQGHYAHALMRALVGEAAPVFTENELAMALSPLDPLRYAMLGTQAHAAINQADYKAAAHWADRAARWPGSHYLLGMLAAAAHQLNEDGTRAEYWRREVAARRPDAGTRRFFEAFPYGDIPERHQIAQALSQAGFGS